MASSEDPLSGSASSGTHYITLRLADALPRAVVASWHEDLERTLNRMRRSKDRALTPGEEQVIALRSIGRLDRYLDQGHGAAYFRDAKLARTVESTLWSGEGQRYHLLAWCVMPNHLHALLHPCPGVAVESVIHDWMAETTRSVNAELHRTGPLWHSDAMDQSVWHPDDVTRLRTAIASNPDQANLPGWPFAGEAKPPVVPLPESGAKAMSR